MNRLQLLLARFQGLERRTKLLIVLLPVLLISGVLLTDRTVKQRTSGVITITADQADTQLRLRLPPTSFDEDTLVENQQPPVADTDLGTGSARRRLDAGRYHIVATRGSNSTIIPLVVKAGVNQDIRVSIKKAASREALTTNPAQNISLTGDGLQYLNTSTRQMERYSFADKRTTPINEITDINVVRWFGPGQAYYQQTGQLWSVLRNGSSQTFYPLSNSAPDTSSVSSAPSGAVSFSTGSKVWLKDTPDATPRQIATLASANAETSLAPDGRSAIIRELSLGHDDTPEPKSVQLYTDGKLSHPTELQGTSDFNWSPDGSVVSFTSEKGVYAYNVRSGKTIELLVDRQTHSFPLTWLGNDSVIFAQNDGIWRYTLADHIIYKLSPIEGTLDATQAITTTADGKNIYFSTNVDSDGNGGYLYRMTV